MKYQGSGEELPHHRNVESPEAHESSPARHRQLRQSRAEETRARILQKAREAFAEHGFDGANVREIAREAETTHSMITYHFGGKEQLWREAVRDMFVLLDQRLDGIVERSDLSAREKLVLLTRTYGHYCAEHPEHARITIAEAIRGGERLEWMVDEFVKTSHATGSSVLQAVIDEGIVPRVPLASFIYAYVGMLQLPFVLAKEAQRALSYDFMSEKAIEAHADAVVALLLSGR